MGKPREHVTDNFEDEKLMAEIGGAPLQLITKESHPWSKHCNRCDLLTDESTGYCITCQWEQYMTTRMKQRRRDS